MTPKEKEKKFFKKKSTRRLILALVFLASILIILNFNTNFGVSSLLRGEGLSMTSHASLGSIAGSAFLWAINMLLYAVFQLMGAILLIAANLFDWAVKASSFNAVMAMTSITEGWRIVRDFLNLFFILVLLFSAFCTIFQVEKYNIKKILLTLVIMALLVNFSFPVSRFIIDAGNIPMYYFFQSMSGDKGSISKNLFNTANSTGNGEATGIKNLIFPANTKISGNSNQTLQLIAAIIFIFLFAITLLIIAVLFVIRMLMLAILIIFSPVGFVASIFPGFSKYSEDWWNQLFKQSFFGTVMAFMLFLSLLIMKETQGSFAKNMAVAANKGSTGFDQIIIGGVTLAIPIALLWIGIISAQSIGITGAGAVIGQGKKVAKWAGKLPWRGVKAGFKSTGIPGGAKQTWDYWGKKGGPGFLKHVYGFRGSEKTEELEARIASGVTGDRTIKDNAFAKRVKDAAERFDTENMTDVDLRNLAIRGNQFEAASALQELANRSKATATDLNNMRNTFGEGSQVFRQLQSKVKAYNPAAAFQHIDNSQGARDNAIYDFIRSNKFDAGKLNAEALSNADLMGTMFTAQAISNDDLDKLRKKSVLHKQNIESSLGTIATRATNIDDESHKNIQMAHISQTGKLNASISGKAAWQKEIFGKAGKDNLKRINESTARDMTKYAPLMTSHINSGQFKDIIRNMEDNAARKELVRYIKDGKNFAARSNEETIQKIINKDLYLSNLA